MSGDASLRDNPDVAAGIELFESVLQAQVVRDQLAGVSVGVVYDQELIYSRGFGYADRETKRPAAADTLYRIASHSKLFTAIAVMQLRGPRCSGTRRARS